MGVRKNDQRLAWEETYRETVREKEDWSDFDATLADGIDPAEKPWKPWESDAAIMRPRS